MTKVSKKKLLRSGSGASQVSGFRIGPLCQNATEIQKGDWVFIDQGTEGQIIGHRLGLMREELRLPIKVLRVEPINGRVILEARRTDGVSFDQVRKAVAIPMSA